MKRLLLNSIIIVLVLAGLSLIGLSLRKTVTLVVNGESRSLTRLALTVGGLLRAEGIAVSPDDHLSPPAGRWLKGGETIVLERAAQVQIVADGKTITLISPERLPARLLSQAGISLHPNDQLLSNGQPISPDELLPYALTHSLQIRRAVSITLSSEAGVEHITSAAATLGEALWQAGLSLYTVDRLQPPPETPLTTNLQVRLQRSRELTIQTQSQIIRLRSAAPTVGEALAEADLPPQGLDYSLPSADAPLPDDGLIRLVRVQEIVIIEQTPLPFETLSQPVADLELDNQTVVQAGEPGITARRVRVRIEDGTEISRQVESEWVARQAQPRIIGYGTQVVMHTLDTPDGTITYWRALQFWATSYHPSEVGGNTTASGKKVRKGLVGVDTTYIPFGTQMYVPGYGFAEAADTGRISGRWIDLGYEDADYVPWHQWVTVYFLWPPPAFIPETIPPPSHY